ncbi:MDR family oxidoreductase [Saccharopolyspora erythraea]|uniref:MDR family oxidoreductase n=1 Tax=Saccharopolyspora erythraea TaxID=1836 RepID=UPI0020132CD5|nr:MDR family oxidoreductase [Saccharopolyspora erythraea]
MDDGPARFQRLSEADLPEGDVTIKVRYSTLNYKDGLAVLGKGKIVRRFPMVCGVDLAGVVESSQSQEWQPGDEVIATGFGLSELHPGGYAERQRVPGEWLVRKPASLELSQTMAIGTAGLTAMLCVLALERAGLSPEQGGEVLVTGAAGGVGSVAVALLAELGYSVTASTGRPETRGYLKELGAAAFIDRSELATDSGRLLDSRRWIAVVDTVGGTTLATAVKQTHYAGAVAACGHVGGTDLPLSVMPLIIRGVQLLGIDAVQCPLPLREHAWQRLARDLPLAKLDSTTSYGNLDEVPQLAEKIVSGQIRGRLVIRVD